MGVDVFVAGWRMQLQSMRNNPDWFLALILVPLQTVVFVTNLPACWPG